ncbi:hypothetical protein CYY_003337 [Polysphondylium violaceum]|uniref:Mannose-P-dolichol utilization defect 1 protein homolog n=1 Tax=Polysphondylium violaceum TaxID=133409 RepID=A0A8J4UUD8_9MYCE|nr:hypothetical protein CYY_003337 [Polysphondylium violaceum]
MDVLYFKLNGIVKQFLGDKWDLGLLISKTLGYAIITGSLILKVPQILKIVSNKSAESISIASIVLESIGFTITLLVNQMLGYPFSTYGESFFILIQSIILLVLVLKYSKKLNSLFYIGSIVYLAASFSIYKFANPYHLSLLQALNIPLFMISKLPQISAILKNKSVGQLSFITCFLNFGGSLARVFTTLKEVNDPVILTSYLIGSFLNGVILVLFFLYWNKKTPTARIVSKEKQK